MTVNSILVDLSLGFDKALCIFVQVAVDILRGLQ
jgi:hypothetical protein